MWKGLLTGLFVASTLFIAVVLAAQEAVLVAEVPATATNLPPTWTPTRQLATTPVYPSPTHQPPTVTATAEATATARPSRTPSRSLPAAPRCVKRQDWVSYTIQPGDTLSSIAERVGLSVQQIKDGNCLRQDLIYAGQTLLLPFRPPVPPAPSPTRKPPRPTRTPTRAPTATSAHTPGPTSTATATSEPGPTLQPTATPPPTNTPLPPTATPVPPTKTPVPPTATLPPPTNTPLPPTATPVSP